MTILLVIHIIVTMLLIAIILLQKSEGGGLGTPSSSGNTFSARGTANILTKVTAFLAATFMFLCIVMTMISHNKLDSDANIISKPAKN